MTDRCFSCWRSKDSLSASDISLNDISRVAKARVPVVLISGGEPTESKDFKEIIHLLENIGSRIHILTNGEDRNIAAHQEILVLQILALDQVPCPLVHVVPAVLSLGDDFFQAPLRRQTKEGYAMLINIPEAI